MWLQCPLVKSPLPLKRYMDEAALLAIKRLKENPQFQEWVHAKPEADVGTARATREKALSMFLETDKRAEEIANIVTQLHDALNGRMRVVVQNRMAYIRSAKMYAAIASQEISEGAENAKKEADGVKAQWDDAGKSFGEFIEAFKKSVKLIGRSSRKIMKLMYEAREMRELPKNPGFQAYQQILERTNLAELLGYFDDVMGSKEDPGALPQSKAADESRKMMLRNLIEAVQEEDRLGKIDALLKQFPIPEEVEVPTLECAADAKQIGANLELGDELSEDSVRRLGCTKYDITTRREPSETVAPGHWAKWGKTSPKMSESLHKALSPNNKGQWSCMRLIGDPRRMQDSYECTLVDPYLGFVAFKGSTRLVSSSGVKRHENDTKKHQTCIAFHRLKDRPAQTRKICCPTFATKCEETAKLCDEVYDKAKAGSIRQAKTRQCARAKEDCKRTQGASVCDNEYEDCLIRVSWTKDVTKKYEKSKDFDRFRLG